MLIIFTLNTRLHQPACVERESLIFQKIKKKNCILGTRSKRLIQTYEQQDQEVIENSRTRSRRIRKFKKKIKMNNKILEQDQEE